MSGTYNFDRGFTQGPNAIRGGATAGDGFASMLLGIPSSGAFGAFIRSHSLNPYYGLYAQDDWKVSQRLTLNIGLRYELEMPRTEREDRLDWFDYNLVNPLSQKVTGLGQIRGQRVATAARKGQIGHVMAARTWGAIQLAWCSTPATPQRSARAGR